MKAGVAEITADARPTPAPAVLLVEPDADDAFRAWFVMKPGEQFAFKHARSAEDAFRMIEQHDFGFLLVGHPLPAHDMMSFLREARIRGLRAPAMLLLRVPSEDLARQAFAAGFVGCFVKEGNFGERLLRCVRHHLEIGS